MINKKIPNIKHIEGFGNGTLLFSMTNHFLKNLNSKLKNSCDDLL